MFTTPERGYTYIKEVKAVKPYAEQTKTYDNGRGKLFTIRLFCQGTYDFTMKDYYNEPIYLVTAMDVKFVHEKVREMRGWESNGTSTGVDSTAMDAL